MCFVTNTEERVEELVRELDEALRTKMLPISEGEKLRGRLQFASSQVFGRKFRRLLKVLSNHVTQGRKTLSQHTQPCLSDIRELLTQNTPRKIEASQAEVLHIYLEGPRKRLHFSCVKAVPFLGPLICLKVAPGTQTGKSSCLCGGHLGGLVCSAWKLSSR